MSERDLEEHTPANSIWIDMQVRCTTSLPPESRTRSDRRQLRLDRSDRSRAVAFRCTLVGSGLLLYIDFAQVCNSSDCLLMDSNADTQVERRFSTETRHTTLFIRRHFNHNTYHRRRDGNLSHVLPSSKLAWYGGSFSKGSQSMGTRFGLHMVPDRRSLWKLQETGYQE